MRRPRLPRVPRSTSSARLAALSNRLPPAPPAAELTGGAASNARAVTAVDYRTPSPIATAQQRSIDTMITASQAGKVGRIPWGEPATIGLKYSGDLGPLQRYHGGQAVGSAATIRPGFGAGLPATSTVPGQPANPMLALLIANESARLAATGRVK